MFFSTPHTKVKTIIPPNCMKDQEELQPNCPLSQRLFSSAPLKLLALLGTFPLPSILAILAFPSKTCLDDRKASCRDIEAGLFFSFRYLANENTKF